jgi:hypothetical protein
LASRDCDGNQRLLDPVQLVQFTLALGCRDRVAPRAFHTGFISGVTFFAARGGIIIRLAAQMAGKQLLGSVGLTSIMSWRTLPGGTHVCDPPVPRHSYAVTGLVQIPNGWRFARLIEHTEARTVTVEISSGQIMQPVEWPIIQPDRVAQEQRHADPLAVWYFLDGLVEMVTITFAFCRRTRSAASTDIRSS